MQRMFNNSAPSLKYQEILLVRKVKGGFVKFKIMEACKKERN